MISAGDFRNGVTIEFEGNIYQIIEFQHVKPGKGAAFVRTKLKNIKSGGVVEKTFRPTEKCPTARIERRDMQYLYNDGDLYTFMDMETYDQISLNQDATPFCALIQFIVFHIRLPLSLFLQQSFKSLQIFFISIVN